MTSNDTETLPETLWHYTDAAGLLGILGNVDEPPTPNVKGSGTFKPILWASAAQFLNDRRELIHGLELVKNHIETVNIPRISSAPAGTYTRQDDRVGYLRGVCQTINEIVDQKYDTYLHCCTISFSEDPDVLSQWRAYGGGVGGFAIGFRASAFPRGAGSVANAGGLGLHKVSYTNNTLPKALKGAVTLFVDQHMANPRPPQPKQGSLFRAVQSLAFFAASVKHNGFEEEREWRFIEPGFFNEPEFRATPAGLVPYRKIELDASAVTGVFVGPGPNQYENSIAARSLLYRFGYYDAAKNVHCSETPFR